MSVIVILMFAIESSKGRVIVHLLHTLYTSGSDSKGTPISLGLGVPSLPLATSME